MPKASKFLKEKFMRVDDVAEMSEEDRRCVVDHVVLRSIGRDRRLVLYTDKHNRGLALNDARIENMIEIASGEDDTDKWRKFHIRLYIDYDVQYEGEDVGGIRIEAVPQGG